MYVVSAIQLDICLAFILLFYIKDILPKKNRIEILLPPFATLFSFKNTVTEDSESLFRIPRVFLWGFVKDSQRFTKFLLH
jgi:hypothetical protein